MRQNLKTILIGLIFFVGGTGLGSTLLMPALNIAQDNSDYWYDQYTDLQADYNTLLTSYSNLFNDYNVLQHAFEDPLTSPTIPTISQIQNWLYYFDDTDEASYTSNWMCGDFAAMLMTRAKEMNWRMRIAVVEFSLEGYVNYGVNTPFGQYGHAFNLIYCQDGSDPDSELDVYYIEPQTDYIWWIHYGDGNHAQYIMWYGYWTGGITSSTHWINYYNYFA